MKLFILYSILFFQQDFTKSIQVLGGDNYPVENWRILVIDGTETIKILKSSNNGMITITNEEYNEYKSYWVRIKFDDYGLIKKLYEVGIDYKPNAQSFTLEELLNKKKIVLPEK